MSPFQIEALPGVPTPEEVSRRLLFANSAGLFLTVFTGASFMPWMWEVIRWVVSHLPFLHPRPVPSLLNAFVHPNWTMGIIWLGYYLFSYGWACLATPPSAPIADQRPLSSHDLAQQSQEPLLRPSLSRPGVNKKKEASKSRHAQLLLSQAWPGEEKHDLLEHCYQEYRQALLRYHPVPLELKTPPTFFYHQGKTLGYHGPIPIVPEELLDAKHLAFLRPALAVHLYWYNRDAVGPTFSPATPRYIPLSALLTLTGNWLWLPVTTRVGIEEDIRRLYRTHQKALILEADAFAVMLGQGPALERQLRESQRVLRQQHVVEEHEPTLSERIGHLEALNKQERAEMRALGLTVQDPAKLPPPKSPQ